MKINLKELLYNKQINYKTKVAKMIKMLYKSEKDLEKKFNKSIKRYRKQILLSKLMILYF